MTINPIAIFRSPFTSKFGIPKQSGLVEELEGEIVFLPEYNNADYVRGIEGFDFLWLVWGFSANKHAAASPLVRPPLLGGNEKMGVFATRSPFRPNAIGLSSVRLKSVETSASKGLVLHVTGADLMDGTPIYDIKPYIEYADSHPNVRCGFVDKNKIKRLDVVFAEGITEVLGNEKASTLRKILELDPRPHYQNDPEKVYGMPFEKYDVKFRVEEGICRVEGLKACRAQDEKINTTSGR